MMFVACEAILNSFLFISLLLPGGVMVKALDSRRKRSRVQVLALSLSGNNLGQVVYTHVPPSRSTVIWYRLEGGGALRPGR